MLDVTHPSSSDDHGDAIPSDPREFAAKVNAWVPHDIVLKDAWFPLAHSFAVTAKPVRRAVYSQPYFLWREHGVALASEFHPAAGLIGAKSTFSDAAGRYPVIEKYGYVWGWFGNPANAAPEHVPSLPYLPEEGGLPLHMLGTVRFDCTAPLSLENLIDLTHADFLHADVVGDEIMDKETVEVFHDSETITMVRTCVNKSVAPIMKWFGGVKSDVQQVRQVIRIYLRSHAAIAYGRFSPGDNVQLFHPCVPETRDRTRLDYAMNTTNVKKTNLFRYLMPKASYKVSRQDSTMTSPQSPRYMHPEKRKDLHSPLDEAGQKYRVLMLALAERQARGDYAYRDNVSADCSDIIGYQKP
ncbi:aromatic ring-hydroxylating dioxygenase subunit alpha [Novosphingobium sp. Fuku2-ISO-50]|uniref:aromatic ring-hydroxylating dioxygenase subunit alpha n=1 Tax=Novosphingobium sp. Fuku2-ISO-50 TaxID=1739114 RepID=UPI000AA2E61C|nr:aromatic ring-hydroxylating dioxygenase subunit alpha [Novosphingobium sp. Fuku2-ISO-50]